MRVRKTQNIEGFTDYFITIDLPKGARYVIVERVRTRDLQGKNTAERHNIAVRLMRARWMARRTKARFA